jgi:hypothetical protein
MSTLAASQSIATNQTNFDVRKEDESVAGLGVRGVYAPPSDRKDWIP